MELRKKRFSSRQGAKALSLEERNWIFIREGAHTSEKCDENEHEHDD
jgi:hypothetical protein